MSGLLVFFEITGKLRAIEKKISFIEQGSVLKDWTFTACKVLKKDWKTWTAFP